MVMIIYIKDLAKDRQKSRGSLSVEPNLANL